MDSHGGQGTHNAMLQICGNKLDCVVTSEAVFVGSELKVVSIDDLDPILGIIE